MPAIRIVIVDDHPVFRQGLLRLLGAEVDMKIVGEARTGREAVMLARTQQPDIMLLDARLDDIDGPEVCELVLRVAPKTAIVMLSGYLQDRLILRSLIAGAKGYLVKDVELEDLKKTIRAVYRGNAVFDPRVTPQIIATVAAGLAGQRTPGRTTVDTTSLLSETDLAIIRYLCRGLSNKEIGALVHLSPHTIKDHLEKIRIALDARSRTDVVAEAFRRGLLEPEMLIAPNPLPVKTNGR
jgi:two-component system, NarL family, response regulator DevR